MKLPALRLVDELECAASVLLAIGLAHLIGARNVSWAAFSGYMVMRGHVGDSLLRGALRIVGTVAGAGLALLLVPLVARPWPVTALAAAAVGGLSLYAALTAKRAYAWLFVGLTFELILFDMGNRPLAEMWPFAEARILEVAAGTAACVAVSVLSALSLRRRWPATRLPPPTRVGWHPQAARHAGQGAIALVLVAALAGSPRWAPAQAAVSVMAAMLVPISSIGASGLGPVSRKLGQRVAGCLGGSLLAAAALFLAHGSPAVLLGATVGGVALGRHLENSGHAHAYVGTQFVLAVLVTLVPDDYAHAALHPALARLGGIVAGLLLLEPVLVAWHLASPIIRAVTGASPVGTVDPPGQGRR